MLLIFSKSVPSFVKVCMMEQFNCAEDVRRMALLMVPQSSDDGRRKGRRSTYSSPNNQREEINDLPYRNNGPGCTVRSTVEVIVRSTVSTACCIILRTEYSAVKVRKCRCNSTYCTNFSTCSARNIFLIHA